MTMFFSGGLYLSDNDLYEVYCPNKKTVHLAGFLGCTTFPDLSSRFYNDANY
jgi:hypothetical protein